MAKKVESPLLAALLGGSTDSGNHVGKVKSKNTAAPKASRRPPAAQAFEGYKPPSMSERHKENARSAKIMATREWIEGHISTTKHDQIHSRANHVIKHGGRMKGRA